jgi:DNA-binding HxlR family transcriptional regulator
MRADRSVRKRVSGAFRKSAHAWTDWMCTLESLRERAMQSRDALELLDSKWRVTLLHLLTLGPLRASELQRAVEEVSPKMLTQTLRGLERDGLIHREVRSIMPPHVEYQLTEMGKGVIPVLLKLCDWAKDNARNRDDARRRFAHSAKNSSGLPVSTDDPLRSDLRIAEIR